MPWKFCTLQGHQLILNSDDFFFIRFSFTVQPKPSEIFTDISVVFQPRVKAKRVRMFLDTKVSNVEIKIFSQRIL